MFRVVICLVVFPTPPAYVERFFGRRIAKPVITHVPGLRSFGFHVFCDKRSCSGIVSLKNSRRLRVTERVEQPSDVNDFLAIEKCAGRFCLGRRCDDVLNEFADNVKRRIVKSAEEIGKEVVTGDTALSTGGDEVGGVGIDVEDHVGREKTDGG